MANLSPHRLACRTISSDGKQPQHIRHSFLSCRQHIFKSIAPSRSLCNFTYFSRYQLKINTWPISLDSSLGHTSGEFVTERTWTSLCQSCKVRNCFIYKYIGETINATTCIRYNKNFQTLFLQAEYDLNCLKNI